MVINDVLLIFHIRREWLSRAGPRSLKGLNRLGHSDPPSWTRGGIIDSS